MSRPGDKMGSTFYNEKRKLGRTPPKSETALRRPQPKSFDAKKKIGDSQNFQQIALHEKDERFRYLLKHGQLKKIEKAGNIIFAQLPQIPNVWVCYRRPVERDANVEKLSLDSLDLSHVPLLEGEEKLKMLTFQHNHIERMENLISLPNLLYVDFYDNAIKEIEGITVPTLKVLLLPKNQITKMRSLGEINKLQVLDLHANRISRIEGISHLNILRILNLAQNQITKIQNIDTLVSLVELNLKNNLIVTIEGIQKLIKLEKCLLANNRIEIKTFQTCELLKLPLLSQLSIENNPCSKKRIVLLRNIMKHLPQLKNLDGNTPTLMEESGGSEEESNHEEVLKLIGAQWEEEKKRIASVEASGGGKKELLKTTCITGGHAEIEDQNILFIYGNSYDVVLTNQNFQDCVEKIRFQFVFIEFLIDPNILRLLSKFKKLKILEFKETYILSLLQLAKLENLKNLKILIVEPMGNPITHCTLLKEFVIYRFPTVIQINREDIKQSDRTRAKQLFNNFDKVLLIPERISSPTILRTFPSQDPHSKQDKNYLKSFNKITAEAANLIVEQAFGKAKSILAMRRQLESSFDAHVLQMITAQSHLV